MLGYLDNNIDRRIISCSEKALNINEIFVSKVRLHGMASFDKYMVRILDRSK